MPQIDRTGTIHFHDASLAVWEEGIADARASAGSAGADAWEREFKRDVFKRIVQTLNRLGWTVGPQTYIFTRNNARHARKGDLQADLLISGRHIEMKMFQAVNCPTRPDNDGRYESNKEAVMPYMIRLEMERTRRRIRDYLCNVFSGYTFVPPEIASPNPDPLAWFNDHWDSRYEKASGRHRFDRGPDGWPSDKELGNCNRLDADGALLSSGVTRWCRDDKGRLLRGRVYGGINGMWDFVYGPGKRDWKRDNANSFFTFKPGLTPMKVTPKRLRRGRLERLLSDAIKSQNFERAIVLRDLINPTGEPMFMIQVRSDGLYFAPNYCGYRKEPVDAGKYTREELRPYQSELRDGRLRAVPVE